MENHEPKPTLKFDAKEQRVYLPELAFDALSSDTLSTIDNLEACGSPDNEEYDYQGFRIENSAYHHGRFTIESSATAAKARLSLVGPNNTRAIYVLDSTLGEADIWVNEFQETDLLLNEDILRLLDRETSSTIFDEALSLREPRLNDIHCAVRSYCTEDRTETTINQRSLYSINQPYTTYTQDTEPIGVSNQLIVRRTIRPKVKGGATTIEAVLERSESIALHNDQLDRTYRYMYSTAGEERIDLVTRASSPQARELHESTYGSRATDQLHCWEEASWALNEALAALDVTRYSID